MLPVVTFVTIEAESQLSPASHFIGTELFYTRRQGLGSVGAVRNRERLLQGWSKAQLGACRTGGVELILVLQHQRFCFEDGRRVERAHLTSQCLFKANEECLKVKNRGESTGANGELLKFFDVIDDS